MRSAVVLLNRDLRVHDHPALAAAHRMAETVVPLFVLDDAIVAGEFGAANRLRFLLDCLSDLQASLRRRGSDLAVRRGDPVAEAVGVARAVYADAIVTSADVSAYATTRQARLAAACREQRIDFTAFPGVTVVPPGELRPAGADHYRVFTPYWRAWRQARWRPLVAPPRALRLPEGVDAGQLPRFGDLVNGEPSPRLPAGGEAVARKQARTWMRRGVDGYAARHDDLAGDATSRLSPYLHFGCLSARELAAWATERVEAEAFLRQLCWRDFHHQVTAAFPAIAVADYRPLGVRWRQDPEAVAAWKAGRTGYPIVDAGMRQLIEEGWMHNRARLIVASFLTRNLHLDWRIGARHFLEWLVDGDIANNSGNWQWVAGTGNDRRPNRAFNPLRQAARFDPDGGYVRRYLPELADVEGPAVHQPWRLPVRRRRSLLYPPPLVEPGVRGPG